MTDPRNPSAPPAEVSHLVRQRMEARARKDWPAADALKAQIEALGWKVVDHGGRSSVSRAAPRDVELEGETRYGSAAAVPSLLNEPATSAWTIVVPASEAPEATSRLLAALRTHAPAGSQVVIVSNDPSDAQQAAFRAGGQDLAPIGGREPEILRTAARLGHAAALNIGLRRAAGELVVLTDASTRPSGDAFAPLIAPLSDPDVAVAGGFGVKSGEPGVFRPSSLALTTDSECAAVLSPWLAFRRSDLLQLGPLDEHFVTPAWLDVWWSLRLRAGQEPEPVDEPAGDIAGDRNGDGAAPTNVRPSTETQAGTDLERAIERPEVVFPAARRAVRVELPLEGAGPAWPPDRSRLARRNMYRVIDRFGWREDLF